MNSMITIAINDEFSSKMIEIPNDIWRSIMNLMPDSRPLYLVARQLYALAPSEDRKYWHFSKVPGASIRYWLPKFNESPEIFKTSWYDMINMNICRYAKYGNFTIVRELCSAGVPMLHVDIALMCAATNNHLDIVKYLNEKYVIPPHAKNSALEKASEKGHLRIVQYLYHDGVSINNPVSIRLATVNNRLRIIKFFCTNGLNRSLLTNILLCAIRNGHRKMVVYLCTTQDCDIKESYNEAIIEASCFGHLRIVKFLHKRGACINTRHNNPLYAAVQNGHLAVVEYITNNCGSFDLDKIMYVAIKMNQSKVLSYLRTIRQDDFSG